MDARQIVEEIIGLDEKIAGLRDRFEQIPEQERAAAIERVLGETRKATGEDDPLPLAMVRVTDLAVALETMAATVLVPGLEHENPDVRHMTGEALLNLVEDDVERLRPAVDYAAKKGGDAAEEMIFVLAATDDEEAPRLIERFLTHSETDVVVAAIEALADTGDEQSITVLEDFVDDPREVKLDADDDGGEQETWRLGDIAREAIEMIEKDLDGEED
jgi:HEAT repeat protein